MASRLNNATVRASLGLLASVLLLLAGFASTAQAAKVHPLLSREAVPNPGSGERFFWSAVNQTTHHFYPSTIGGVYNFTAAGVFDQVEPELTEVRSFQPFGIAVDNSGGPQNGYIYTTQVFVGFIQQFTLSGTPTAVKITNAAIPPDGTAQGGGLPPVVNTGEFHPRAAAVDDAGNVFVSESSAGAIDEFTPAGTFVAQIAAGSIGFTNSIALDTSGDIYSLDGGVNPSEQGIFEYEPSGNCVPGTCAALIPGQFNAVTVDRVSGTIFTTASDEGQGSFSEYDAAGNLLGTTQPNGLVRPNGIAVDETSGNLIVADEANFGNTESTMQVYGPVEVVPDVETELADPVSDHSATFHGKIGAAEVPGGTCVFQYVDEAGFKANRFKDASKAPCEPGGPFSGTAINEVHAEVSGLIGGTTYHYRLLGENENGSNAGEDIPFTTLGPSISETEASAVTETSATLSGFIDPRGASTRYAFRYVTQAQFEASGYAEAINVPVPPSPVPTHTTGTGDVEAGSNLVQHAEALEGAFLAGQSIEGQGIPPETKIVSIDDSDLGNRKLTLSKQATESLGSTALISSGRQPVSQPLASLAPDTIYHFRIAATSTGGETAGSALSEDQVFSTYAPPSIGLPDGRAYEQASPVEKNGENIQGELQAVQAAADGNAITFRSLAGIPGGDGQQTFPSYAASRAAGGNGWSTRGMLPPASYGPYAGFLGWDEELTSVYDFASGASGPTRLLVRSMAEGTVSEVAQLPQANTGTPFYFAGASANGEVALLESRAGGVIPGDLAGKQNVYAYDRETGNFVLAGVMNDLSVPFGGAMGGPYEWAGSVGPSGGRAPSYYTQPNHAISSDGRRIFFTAGTGQLYVRENPLAQQSAMNGEECIEAATKACTVRVSAPEEGVADPGTNAVFSWASADGSLVYFLDKGRLTADSTAGAGYDLYRYDVETGQLSDVTVDTADARGAQVEGVLGVSAGGNDAYFVASGALAEGAEKATPSETNLYALHGEEAVFVARLSNDATGEGLNWIPAARETNGGGVFVPRTSRVSADGQALLFTSKRHLTSYRSHGADELYLYRTGRGLLCVSCNPTQEAPRGDAGVQKIPAPGISSSKNFAFMTRNLSADGRRVIFDSPDRLVSADENDVNDVYEWEEKGKGSCNSEAQDGGCLSLISDGTGSTPSYFGDADVEGNNVFFFTIDHLVAQDTDQLVDVYDARVGGGIASQNRRPVPPCEGESCLSPGSSGQGAQTPGTATFSGSGNAARLPACTKGRPRKHGRCVKRSHAKKKAKKHHKQRRAQRAKGGSGR